MGGSYPVGLTREPPAARCLVDNTQLYRHYRQHCEQRKAPVFNYAESDFEVFRPAGATRCTDGGEIWHGGVDRNYAGTRADQQKILRYWTKYAFFTYRL